MNSQEMIDNLFKQHAQEKRDGVKKDDDAKEKNVIDKMPTDYTIQSKIDAIISKKKQ